MKKYLILSLSVAALSACSGPASDSPFQPGQWEVSAGPSAFEVPGATAEQKAAFEGMLGETESQEQCLTQAEADRGLEPLAEAFSQSGQCEVSDFEALDGSISGTMACTVEGVEAPLTSQISGTYSDTAFDMDVKLNMSQPELPEGRAEMTIAIEGKRIGDC